MKRFIEFCRHYQVQPFPASPDTVAYFAAHLSSTLQWRTIKLYIAAVAADHRKHGWPDPTAGNHQLHLALRGLQRINCTKIPQSSRCRLPITPTILNQLLKALKISPMKRADRLMLHAAFTLAFAACLRVGEFTSSKSSHSNAGPIVASISFPSKRQMLFHIKRSKTDQHRHGATVPLARTNTRRCPVRAMQQYLHVRRSGTRSAPLFLFHNGTPLTRARFLHALRSLLTAAEYKAAKYNTHSFRIGAATAAALAGYTDSQIRTLGRWRSSAFLTYIRRQYPRPLTRRLTRI